MKLKLRKWSPEDEAGSFYTVDEVFMREGYKAKQSVEKTVEKMQKEAYVKGFHRGQEQAFYGFWDKDRRALFREAEKDKKNDEHEHFWVTQNQWDEYIGKTFSNLAASAYRDYADGKISIEEAMEAISARLPIEFEDTKMKEDAENAGKEIPETREEKWLSEREVPEGVCMLSLMRDVLKEGRKEGYDIGYLKGFLAAQKDGS